ncbi:MAG: hypothetical protein QME64_03975 [bacterium]|nr:hypothetical protein [bacterium]
MINNVNWFQSNYFKHRVFGLILLLTLGSILFLSSHNHDINDSSNHYFDCPLCYFSSISVDTSPIPNILGLWIITYGLFFLLINNRLPHYIYSGLISRAPPILPL